MLHVEGVPHDRHDVVIRAHDHDLGGGRARLQGERRSVVADGEGLRVVDHLAEDGGLGLTWKWGATRGQRSGDVVRLRSQKRPSRRSPTALCLTATAKRRDIRRKTRRRNHKDFGKVTKLRNQDG